MIWLIGSSGAIGALLRFYLGKWIAGKTGMRFPWGTWVINMTGSLLLGILFTLKKDDALPEWVWLMAGVGFCGAYTTFSTFGYETILLMEKGHWKNACIYVLSSVGFGLLLAWCGIKMFS
jgi:CrcB protein